MSESEGDPGRREVAHRLFAAEYDDADLSYSESEEERAPNYVVTPAGARVNRLFVVGVLTEIESVSDDYLRARIVDPTGPFVVYAGQYQPEAMRFLESADAPTFVAVTGKARTFEPDDADRVYTSIRPESINEVDAATRDRWVIQAAEATLDRIARVAEAKATGLDGDDLRATLAAADLEEELASGIPIALAHYGTTGEYLEAMHEVALDALRVVAGERDEVEATLPAPAEGGDEPISDLAKRTLETVRDETDDAPAGDVTEESIDESTATQTAQELAADRTDAEVGSTQSATDDSGPAETAQATDTETEPAAEDSAETQVATAGDTGGTTEGVGESDASTASGDLGDFDGDFDIDEEEREAIESEYGTEFKSGTEVEEPGESDIETPAPDGTAEETGAEAAESGPDASVDDTAGVADEDATDDVEPDATDATEVETADEAGTADADETNDDIESFDEAEPANDGERADESEQADDEGSNDTERPTDDAEPAADVALDDAVMDAMTDLDEGDGADREAVIGAVVDRTGADPGAVEDAIQEALMDGLCYEPDDGTLKPI